MTNNYYTAGFCDAAANAGVSPVELAKTAVDATSILADGAKYIKNMDPHMRRALAGALLTGGGSLMFNNEPTLSGRLSRALGMAAAGGLGAYGLSQLSTVKPKADPKAIMKRYVMKQKIKNSELAKLFKDNTKWLLDAGNNLVDNTLDLL